MHYLQGQYSINQVLIFEFFQRCYIFYGSHILLANEKRLSEPW